MESYGAVNAALYINLVPIFGVVSAAILVREEPGPAVLLGGLMVFAGITLVNRPAFLRPLGNLVHSESEASPPRR